VPLGRSSFARVAWILAAVAVVFVAWLAANAGAGPGIGYFYAVPIGLATWWFGLRAGVLTALACCALYLVGALIHPVPSLGFALALRAIAFAAVVVLVSAVRERLLALEHSAEELEAIRAALTPADLPQLPGVDAGAAFVASEYGVSGDFYLLTNGPDSSTIAVVGDVVGHGPKAARLATFIRAQLAAFAANTSDPAEILTLANAALVERSGQNRELVSAVCLRFRGSDSMVSCALAGHPPPLCLPSFEELRPDAPTFLLGAQADLVLATADIRLEHSDGVLVYTDGATDVRQGERLLGLEGMSRLLEPLAALPARALALEAQRALLEWAEGSIGDDLCLLVLKPEGLTPAEAS
jgi:serine phosphatase RsbU (regulator of sigma subunit)